MGDKIRVEIGGRKVEAEVAETFLSRAKGLSFRSSGKMLFKFPQDTRSRVDMMFLSRPLNLYFLNSEREVIDVQEAEPWGWNPKTWRTYSPGQRYRYLLESFETLDIEEGDRLNFEV